MMATAFGCAVEICSPRSLELAGGVVCWLIFGADVS